MPSRAEGIPTIQSRKDICLNRGLRLVMCFCMMMPCQGVSGSWQGWVDHWKRWETQGRCGEGTCQERWNSQTSTTTTLSSGNQMHGSVRIGKGVCSKVDWQSSDGITYTVRIQRRAAAEAQEWVNARLIEIEDSDWLSLLTQRGECKEMNTHLLCNHFLLCYIYTDAHDPPRCLSLYWLKEPKLSEQLWC